MRSAEALAVAKETFAQEPAIVRAEVDVRPGKAGQFGLDFTFVVEGDLHDGETRIIPLVTQFMDRYPHMPVEFVVLPETVVLEPHGQLLIQRRNRRDLIEPGRPPG